MNHYCTLFDSHYLTRGLSLYDSLLRTGEDFRLYILCFDEQSFEILNKMDLPGVQTIKQSDFETPELLNVKPGRTKAEYCWTSTPHLLKYCLEKFNLNQVTYLDADIYFFKAAETLLEELKKADGSILLTEHRYAPPHLKNEKSGRYCVQFMTFKNDKEGSDALNWWAERCIEWCFGRHEDGKFGDQKYLDDWPTRFEKVHVLKNIGGGVAPWNVEQYEVKEGPTVNGKSVVFYHFHHLRWLSDGTFDLAFQFKLNDQIIEHIYKPYLAQLKHNLNKVKEIDPNFSGGIVKPGEGLRSKLSEFKRKLTGKYFVVKNL